MKENFVDLKENFMFSLEQLSSLRDCILTVFLNTVSSDSVWKLLELVYRSIFIEQMRILSHH